jgi:hypothetical protein
MYALNTAAVENMVKVDRQHSNSSFGKNFRKSNIFSEIYFYEISHQRLTFQHEIYPFGNISVKSHQRHTAKTPHPDQNTIVWSDTLKHKSSIFVSEEK